MGTAAGRSSRVWFTVSHGILNEVYYPRLDQACIRDLGLIVTDGQRFFSEEKRATRSELRPPGGHAPAFRLLNTCVEDRYRIAKDVVSDPRRDVVLQSVAFQPLMGSVADYRVYAFLAPHLGNHGAGNTAWVGDYKGVPMFFATRGKIALALACSVPWIARSVGFVGASDGWLDLEQHKQLTWSFERAEDGNVAIVGELDLRAQNGKFVMALGFGTTASEAGHQVLASLDDGFDRARNDYEDEWARWHASLAPQKPEQSFSDRPALLPISAALLRTHESKDVQGALVASLSIPWGMVKGDDDLGGYHLVWPRDLVESASGFLAAGALDDARRVLGYLEVIQEADGHWAQNTWLDGSPYWGGLQMDETALPILLVDLLQRYGAPGVATPQRFWPMIRRAAAFLAENGPVSPQDRWEEDGGYSPFTVGAEIAALLVAADCADANGEPLVASYLRETADAWNQSIDRWMYAVGTTLARKVGVEGYYVRLGPGDGADSAAHGLVPIKNHPSGEDCVPAVDVVSADALALVRFGLREAGDPRIRDTVKVIDALLKVDLPGGPAWHRYNDDGYGEHDDGAPFDGTGVGRAWPLLVGERAHYAIAAGDLDEATRLLRAFESFANEGGMLPEQVWDSAALPARGLFPGQASGSAMPLVWAHAEYIKLRRSIRDGAVFDRPRQTVKRYLVDKVTSPHAIWRFNQKSRSFDRGKILRIELRAQAVVHWGVGAWQGVGDVATRDAGLGVHVADLPTRDLASGSEVRFTFHWNDAARWEGEDFSVTVAP